MHFPNPIARADNPDTSHQAAAEVTESGTRHKHAERVLELVKAQPGSTATELLRAQGDDPDALNEYQIRRRLPDLVAAGLVVHGRSRICRVRRRQMTTWLPAPPAPPAPPAGLFDNAATAKLPD